jgi:hydroxymethylpyrimidine kinase/phosphomethylpyrimidine kinase
MDVTPEFLEKQLDSIFTDIYPQAVKIGMVSQKEIIDVIANKLKQYNARNIVLDPVMVATSGAKLISDEAIHYLKETLFPLATVLTPNILEAEVITNMSIQNEESMKKAAKQIGDQYHCAVLLKGGHKVEDANDLLYKDNQFYHYKGKRIDNDNTHGTGCTLSSAIASSLANGLSLQQSIQHAKEYISGALNAQLDLGSGSGPMDHAYNIKNNLHI